MARSSREVPKEIAAFGERQFKDTGAAAVEVLRVKAAVMRKHFKKLKGITFLVAVVSLDRVRVYFFNVLGVMLVGENVEPSIYSKIRRASKLIAKFEKPKELTPEELRIEATQELRDSLAKSIRRISRSLASGEPSFPDIFITRAQPTNSIHTFGLQIGEKGELLFEEAALSEKSAEGIITRTAFLTLISDRTLNLEIASIIGNGMALALLKGAEKKAMLEKWRKKSKGSDSLPLVNHIITHALSYSNDGFSRILSLLQQSPGSQSEKWVKAIEVIHEETYIAIGTEEYHIIKGFCETLSKPRKLEKRRHILESIHLEPRVICDPTPLGIQLSVLSGKPVPSAWLEVDYIEGHGMNTFSVTDEVGPTIKSIDYWLNLEDVYPSSGGLISHGKDIVRRALMKLGIVTDSQATFEGRVSFADRTLKSTELAVLERLSSGGLEVLSNTLVGSPQAVGSLLKQGQIALVPGFNHIGVNHDFVIQGEYNEVLEVSKACCLEASVFATDSEATAIVSAPASWKTHLFESVQAENLSLWPIQSVKSPRNLLRKEQPFSPEDSVFTWNAGVN
ncbi:MAG: hypothetical protein ACW98U_06460 [Candidatus Thorarchaeota archaeon]